MQNINEIRSSLIDYQCVPVSKHGVPQVFRCLYRTLKLRGLETGVSLGHVMLCQFFRSFSQFCTLKCFGMTVTILSLVQDVETIH